MKYAYRGIEFVTDRGYHSVTDFAEAVNEDVSNVHKVLKGKQKPKIQKILTYAAALDVDVMKLLEMFYPEETKEYKAIRRQKKEERKHG